jgi:hypothetical protein
MGRHGLRVLGDHRRGERAGAVPRHVDRDLADVGADRLGRSAVAGVPATVTAWVVSLVVEVLSHLDLQRRFQHLLGPAPSDFLSSLLTRDHLQTTALKPWRSRRPLTQNFGQTPDREKRCLVASVVIAAYELRSASEPAPVDRKSDPVDVVGR